MFDIGFWEIAVIAAIMLVVLGPERLPGVARTAGFWLSKLRRMVSDVKSEVKREMDAAELKDLADAKNQIQDATSAVHKEIQQAGKTAEEQMNKDVLKNDEATAADSKADLKKADSKKESGLFNADQIKPSPTKSDPTDESDRP